MPKRPPNQAQIDKLALAVAEGRTVHAAGKLVGMAESTARRYALEPSFHQRVDALRREIISRSVGKLARLAVKAADRLGKLVADGVEPEIQLKAARGILADLIAIQSHEELGKRLTELEQELARNRQHAGPSRPAGAGAGAASDAAGPGDGP